MTPKNLNDFRLEFVCKVATMGDKRLLIIPKAYEKLSNKIVGKYMHVTIKPASELN